MRRSLCTLLVAASLLAASGAGGGTGQVQRLTIVYAGAPVGSPDSRTYTWDGNSNLTRITETTAGNTIALETQYDVHNRPIQLTDAWNRSWTQAFDDADQRTALTSPGVPGVQWQYDAGSRPVQITVEGAGTYALRYDLADRNTGITHPNAAETTHAFDTAGRIVDIQHQRAGALTRYQYSYDANGNRLTQTETLGNQTIANSFAYDKADRLVTITEPDKHTAYTLDGSGNRIEVREGTNANNAQRKYTAEFNTRNQLTQQQQHDNGSVIATTSFHYDPNGNLIRQSTGGVETEWRYDVLDRLIETTPPTGPPTQYRYGPGDVRIAKIRNGVEVRYHYDGERLSLETNSLGNPQRHYAYSAAGLLNTTLLGPTPQHRSAHLDAMGSPVLITGSDGSIINRTRFDAWGVEQSLLGARDQAIAFQGYWSGIELEETGTLLSAARLYIPSLGIFAERDPVEGTAQEPISFNPYLLGRANPHYWMDPDGRAPEGAWTRDGVEAYDQLDRELREKAEQSGWFGFLGYSILRVGNAGLSAPVRGMDFAADALAQSAPMRSMELTRNIANESAANLAPTVDAIASPVQTGLRIRDAAVDTIGAALQGDRGALSDITAFSVGALVGGGSVWKMRPSGV